MIVDYGMSSKLGPVAFGPNHRSGGNSLFNDTPQLAAGTSQTIDEEIRELVDQARDRSLATLKDDRTLLDRLSEVLIAREVIDGDDLRKWVDGEEPIPTDAELELEHEERRSANGHKEEQTTGPQLLAAGAGANGDEQAREEALRELAGEAPPRPD
jgi:hypothetical protein